MHSAGHLSARYLGVPSLDKGRRAAGTRRLARPGAAYGLRAAGVGLWAFLFALAGSLFGQFTPPETTAVHSHSDQFIASAMRSGMTSRAPADLATNLSYVRLEPTLLTVSCERIKQHLLRQLQADSNWRGKIYLSLYPAEGPDDAVLIASEKFRDGWLYRVALPAIVQRTRYVRAITQVLLLEMANRNAAPRSAEIPAWLTEGLTEQLLTSSEMEIILPPPRGKANGLPLAATFVNERKEHPLKKAHDLLLTHPPLTFEQLSWPEEGQLDGESGEIYRSSALLFVHNLLQFKDGPASLRAMLAALPQHYNWQFAFLRAFQAHFQRPLDIEKWWALQAANFTGRDLAQAGAADESWQKLSDSIRSVVQVRTGTNELPLRAEIPLQTIIRDWDRIPQTQALQAKLRELQVLRLRTAQELLSMVDDYRRVIEAYLQKLEKPGFSLPFRKRPAQRRVAQETVGQLDALDARLALLRPAPKPSGQPPAQAANR